MFKSSFAAIAAASCVVFAVACEQAATSPPEPSEFAPPALSFDQGGVPNAASGLEPSVAGAFEVIVKVTATIIPGATGPVGTEFPNCYTFQEDGVWIDPGFPELGTWTQDAIRGATARYTATAQVDGLLLEQGGKVTPFRGRDSRKLKAYTSLAADGTVLAEFLSRGHEVDSCD